MAARTPAAYTCGGRGLAAPSLAALLILTLCGCAGPVAPVPLTRDPATLPDAELTRRIDFIEERLEAARLPAQAWHWSWLAVNGGAGVGLNTGLAVADDSSEGRSAAIVQAVYGLAGAAFQYLAPMRARHGAAPLRVLPDDSREQRMRKLERAERMLQENAARSAERTSWIQHLGNAVASVAAGLVVFAFGGDTEAWITGGSIFAGGELFLWTVPPGPQRDLEEYRKEVAGSRALTLRF